MQAAAIRAREEVGEEASVKEARVSSVVTSSEEARSSVLITLSMSEKICNKYSCPFIHQSIPPTSFLVSSGKSSIMRIISFVS